VRSTHTSTMCVVTAAALCDAVHVVIVNTITNVVAAYSRCFLTRIQFCACILLAVTRGF